MQNMQAHTMNLEGTSYEIGCALGRMTAGIPPLRAHATGGMEGFGPAQADEAIALFDRWCPGLTEELRGFADTLETRPEQVLYYAMTYLLPRCSQIGLTPGLTAEGKPLVARNYEFNHEAEDFCLMKTAVKGKYTHMGTSVLQFGREDGLNEFGLSVTMSSCGFPVGPMPYMRAPKLRGLQFWAVIRALLENCRDVAECLAYLEGMPIAYNLNMILMDKEGNAALYETLDGRTAVKRVGPDSPEALCATNHVVLPELVSHEPEILVHSARRYDYIRQQLDGKTGVSREQLKGMLLAKYPDGLCCHFFEEFFGTTKSMVISPADGTIELCWGGRAENGWRLYDIASPLENGAQTIGLNMEKATPGTYGYQPR